MNAGICHFFPPVEYNKEIRKSYKLRVLINKQNVLKIITDLNPNHHVSQQNQKQNKTSAILDSKPRSGEEKFEIPLRLKLGYSEKAPKFHLKFDITQ